MVVRGVRRVLAVRRGEDHTFGSVDIGTGGGGSLPAFGIIGIIGLALVAIVFLYWLSRRVRVRAPAPAS